MLEDGPEWESELGVHLKEDLAVDGHGIALVFLDCVLSNDLARQYHLVGDEFLQGSIVGLFFRL